MPVKKTVRISDVKNGYVSFATSIEMKNEKTGQTYQMNGIKAESIRVTDVGLALQAGALLVLDGRIFELAEFPAPLPGSSLNVAPDINRNPYNFVGLPEGGPWLEVPDATSGKYHGHQCWHPDLLHGHFDITIKARSPVFVPESATTPQADAEPQSFYRLRRWVRENGEHNQIRSFAIPGSSLKGALRSMVEALANDRLGVIDDRKYYEMKIPYRRRAFNNKERFHVGRAKLNSGLWTVTVTDYVRTNVKDDYPSNLLVQPARHTKCTEANQLKTYEIPGDVIKRYEDNLDHKHYRLHYQSWKKQWQDDANKVEADREKCKPNYKPSLDGMEFPDVLAALRMPTAMAKDDEGVLVFFTLKRRSDGVEEIDSFGRNVNYLWPSIWSIKDLVGGWFPPPPEAKQLGLGKALGLAERMFGFVSDHDKNGSHPFRGKLRFEPLWVPTETNPIEIQLAPLTSPKSRAKSRPLYLAGRQNGTSASYSDPEYAKPEFRGRKFYWKQRYKNGDLWEFHKYNENAHASGQRQPKFAALPASTKFETRIHFENLSQPEVGVLLYALLGLDSAIQPNGSWKSGNHCIHLGKGKPRGLGVCEVEAKITWFKPKEEYASLRSRPSRPVATEEEIGQARYAFASWCEARAHAVGQVGPFESLLHISEFLKLHSYPTEDSVRYYPVNWSQYTWLPEPNRNPDEPQGRSRPLAMDTARKLEP